MVASTSDINPTVEPLIYRFPIWALAVLALVGVLLYLAFASAIDFMVGQWNLDEFSHGYLIPFISVFLIWRRRATLQRLEFRGSWSGLAVVLAGLALDLAGRMAALYAIQHIALLVVIAGLVLSLAGWNGIRVLGAPLGVLIFMVPLPNILLNSLSAQLQLISSSFGVWLLRQVGAAVFLEGNVIDLGSYKLEVAQACSGLRYLLPLMTLAFLIACFYRTALWKRCLLFLSSVPLTLLMNSLRIAAIGIMVDQWGPAMAQGLIHQVQGWMMFMLSSLLLLLEMVLLSKVGRDRKPWREAFGMKNEPPIASQTLPRRTRTLPAPLLLGALTVLLFSAAAMAMPAERPSVPARESFASFPLQMGSWSGRREAMDAIYLDTLKLDDYLLADYTSAATPPVNLYVAWYDSQRPGDATHSPKACLPGGGWHIDDLRQMPLAGIERAGKPLRVNRVLISYDEQRELVYYWFEQRGRVLTNEYLIKWYLLIDALRIHRTDGALIRVSLPLPTGMSESEADATLRGFIGAAASQLTPYVPE